MVSSFKKLASPFLVPYFFILCGVYLRLHNLGLNPFVGDELSTIDYLIESNLKKPEISLFLKFLFRQDRPPGQYLINYLNIYFFGYINEFQLRFPYFVFSCLSIITVYFLVKYLFQNKLITVLSCYFFAYTGLFIMFGRISQYQSFLVLTIPIVIHLYIKGIEEEKMKLVFLSGILFTTTLFFHIDSITLLVFFFSYLFHREYVIYTKSNVAKTRKKFLNKAVLTSIVISICTLSFFYLFFRNSDVTKTTGYLNSRIFGINFLHPNLTTDGLGQILDLYMPIESWIVILILTFIGVFSLSKYFSRITFFNFTISSLKQRVFLAFTLFFYLVLLLLGGLHFMGRKSTILVFILSFIILFLFFVQKKLKSYLLALCCWFIIPFLVYFFVLNDPRTHVYVVFIPGFILAALGCNYLFNINKSKLYKFICIFLFVVFSLLNLYFYYLTIIDRVPEYPWYKKSFLYRDLTSVNRTKNTGLKLFGFSTNNHYGEIKNLFSNNCLYGSYSSNEKPDTLFFYLQRSPIPLDIRNLETLGPNNIIYFVVPSRFSSLTLPKARAFIEYRVLKVFFTNGKPSVYIFGRKESYLTTSDICNFY